MWAATAVTIVYSARRVQSRLDDRKIPLMGVLGAFVFAAQMINFAIPGTGSSGHLGGGLLLAILLGPHAAFLTLSSVLTVQALFFADGGLLALGCNIFNLGFFPCFIAYPFIYKKIVRDTTDPKRLVCGSILSAMIGLQLGSLGVVLQTYLSGIAALPFFSFLLMMQPIHLAIGLVEGLATTGVVSFILGARPEILASTASETTLPPVSLKNVLFVLVLAFMVIAGLLSWFASENPDGLEWSIAKTSGSHELAAPQDGLHSKLQNIQEQTSLLPDYDFKESNAPNHKEKEPAAILPGPSVAGLLGGLMVLTGALLVGFLLKKRKQPV